jgi:type VI secretion system secreted protein Hcp
MTDRLFQLEQEISYSRQQADEEFADADALESRPFDLTNSPITTRPRSPNPPGQRVAPPNQPMPRPMPMPMPPQVIHQQLPDTAQIYMTMRGLNTGDIKGPVTLNGRQGSIQVLGFSHKINSPRNPLSGLPTGKRIHLPLIVAKPLDQSTPLLYQILATNENILTVTLKFWSNSSGMDKNIFTIMLTNANIARIQSQSPNQQSAIPINNTHSELISFTYEKIEWTWVDNGITSTDDWNRS